MFWSRTGLQSVQPPFRRSTGLTNPHLRWNHWASWGPMAVLVVPPIPNRLYLGANGVSSPMLFAPEADKRASVAAEADQATGVTLVHRLGFHHLETEYSFHFGVNGCFVHVLLPFRELISLTTVIIWRLLARDKDKVVSIWYA